MNFAESLGPRLLGAEILVRIAQRRDSGLLQWADSSDVVGIIFVAGRPQVLLQSNGTEQGDKSALERALRDLSIASGGTCSFEKKELSDVAHHESFRLDTLGLVLTAVVRELQSAQIDSFWDARMRYEVRPTSIFERLASTVAKLNECTIERPQSVRTVGQLLTGCSIEEQRAWIALIVLGAMEVVHVPQPATEKNPTFEDASDTLVETLSQKEIERRRVIQDIQDAHAQLEDMNHYQVLGVSMRASPETVNGAFLEKAKLWHSDQYAGMDLGEAAKLLADLFTRAEQAHQVLMNEDERKNYDFILDRKSKGLPIDPKIILEAEGLFRRAQVLFRRGNIPAAEPLLREAVALNKGEPEFWAYLGYTIYVVHGRSGLKEALRALDTAEGGAPELDCVFEFQGRIARNEGDFVLARRKLLKAVELNPYNRDAERELRVINMREEVTPDESGFSKALKGLFKRK